MVSPPPPPTKYTQLHSPSQIKNSWNTDWGEDGFYRIVRGENKCGLANDAVHSVV